MSAAQKPVTAILSRPIIMNDERDICETQERSVIHGLYREPGIVLGAQTFRCASLRRCSEAGTS